MKRFFATLASLILFAGISFAQDMKQATELAQAANAELTEGNLEAALDGFKAALTEAEACGEQGEEVASTCKDIIPRIMVAIAKKSIDNSQYEEAVGQLQEVIDVADVYENYATLNEALDLIPKIYMKQAGELFNAKDFAAAAEVYKKVIENDPANGMAALRLGAALASSGDTEGAKAAYLSAAENGQKNAALKQLNTLALKTAASSLKEKAYDDAVKYALESLEYAETDKAYQIAGQASQLAGKSTDAITYFEKFLAIAPESKNAGQIAFTVGALYQQAKNNAKAKEYYQKALTDPKYGAEAKKLIDTLK